MAAPQASCSRRRHGCGRGRNQHRKAQNNHGAASRAVCAAKQASKDARERFRLKEATQPEDAQLVESYRLAKAALNDHLKEQEAARFEQLLSASGSSAEIDTKKRKVAATGDGKERVNSSGESQPPGKKPRAADDSSSGVASKKPSSEQGKKESNRSRRRRERRNEWNQQQGAQES